MSTPEHPQPTPTTTAEAAAPAANPTPVATNVAENSANGPPAPQPGATPSLPGVPAATATPTPDSKPAPTKTVAEIKEPQNDLTRKFKDSEWKALREFRTKIPDVFSKAYPDHPDAKTRTVTLWNIPINEETAKTDARTSVVLMKFLRARNLSISEAETMMVSTLRWRDEFKIDDVMQESFPEDVFGGLGYISGTDKRGAPVSYNIYGGKHDLKAVFGDVQRFLRWRVQFMERGVSMLDFETVDSMVQVHDYLGVTMNSRDANAKQAANEASSIFGAHYPEFLARKYFVNVPAVMSWVFWLFKPIIPSQSFAKMEVCGKGQKEILKALKTEIDEEQIPQQYGGKLDAF